MASSQKTGMQIFDRAFDRLSISEPRFLHAFGIKPMINNQAISMLQASKFINKKRRARNFYTLRRKNLMSC